MFIESVDKGLQGVLDIEQICLDNNIDAEEVISLRCHFNEITQLKGLDKLVNLEVLNCSCNRLTELDLSKLVNLLYLRCDYNELSEIKGLDKLVNLQWLNDEKYIQPEPKPVILDNKR